MVIWLGFLPCIFKLYYGSMDLDFDVKPIYMVSNFVNLKPQIKMYFYQLNFHCIFYPKMKPEDHWSCKRSPDILTLVKHKTYKSWKIYGKEMTLTFNTHIT